MALLVVHLQVVGAVCVCSDEGDGDHDGHAHVALAPHHGDHGDADASAKRPADSDDDREPCRCECPPSQPFMTPEGGPLEGPSRAGGVFADSDVASFCFFGHVLDREAPSPTHARPPPFLRGVSSTSPTSLPKLLI